MRAEGRSPCRRHFIIIGAMKAGTTSLYRFLTSHPEISGPSTKELHYFSLDVARYGRIGYEMKFLGLPGPVLGEASPSYAEYPRFGDTARRIRMLLPRVKLIYCVRDPVERMRSHFNHEVLEGRQQPTADTAAWTTEYLAPSLYGLQLERYLRYFDPSAIAVVHANQLRDDRQATLAELYAFLGVDGSWAGAADVPDQYTSEERARIDPRLAPLKRWPVTRRLSRHLPSPLRGALRSAASARGSAASSADGSTGEIEVPPVPVDMLASIQADRELFVETASQCVVVGDVGPDEWWSDVALPSAAAAAVVRRRQPVGRQHAV